MNATERDTGTGAAIRYRIAAGGANRFEIDEVTGLIETSAVLDREDISRYILTVEARDMGAVSLTSFVQVCTSNLNSFMLFDNQVFMCGVY